MTFDEFVALASSDARWHGVSKLPWGDRAFSELMLREHLSQLHDGASRRLELVERHVRWIHEALLAGRRQRILDLGCGPGLYVRRFASLGHVAVGIDIAPAALAHAQAQREESPGRESYILADFLALPVTGPFDLVMILHGEFNTLTPAQARGLLVRLAGVLAPNGRLLIEAHPLRAVEAMGSRGRVWYAVRSGLFGPGPHLRMDESRWDAETSRSTNLNWVLDPATLSVQRFGTVTQGYSEQDYARLLADAGFPRQERYASLTGDGSDENYIVLLAST
jgi:SAM-dependent methyltransferase